VKKQKDCPTYPTAPSKKNINISFLDGNCIFLKNNSKNINTVATKNLRKSSVYVLVPAVYAILAKIGIRPNEAADIATSNIPPIFLVFFIK